MEEKIRALLTRYYSGETTLKEEQRLRQLLKEVDGFEEERLFFLGLEELGGNKPERRTAPGAEGRLVLWQKVAAIILVFLILGWLAVEQQKRVQQEEAYGQVVEALALIQKNMKKGTSSLEAMEDMRYLNTPNELFNIKKIKEESQ